MKYTCQEHIVLVKIELYIILIHEDSIHLGQMTHACVSKLTYIGADNDLSLVRLQAIISSNAGFLLIGPREHISVPAESVNFLGVINSIKNSSHLKIFR